MSETVLRAIKSYKVCNYDLDYFLKFQIHLLTALNWKNWEASQNYSRVLSVCRSDTEKNSHRRKFLLCVFQHAEEPGGLQSVGSQTARHDWATNQTWLSD